MLDFMIIGLPRSGTTWAANFFCTERSLCFHDPLYTTHYQDWDTELPKRAQEGAEVGVSCTGIWRWPWRLGAEDLRDDARDPQGGRRCVTR